MALVKASLIIVMVIGWLIAGKAEARRWGNASCSGYRHATGRRKPNATDQAKKYCDFLIGDPHTPVALKRKFIPDGERLWVLGRSEALEGFDHGDSWYQVKTQGGATGYVDYSGVKCDGAPGSCKEKVVE